MSNNLLDYTELYVTLKQNNNYEISNLGKVRQVKDNNNSNYIYLKIFSSSSNVLLCEIQSSKKDKKARDSKLSTYLIEESQKKNNQLQMIREIFFSNMRCADRVQNLDIRETNLQDIRLSQAKRCNLKNLINKKKKSLSIITFIKKQGLSTNSFSYTKKSFRLLGGDCGTSKVKNIEDEVVHPQEIQNKQKSNKIEKNGQNKNQDQLNLDQLQSLKKNIKEAQGDEQQNDNNQIQAIDFNKNYAEYFKVDKVKDDEIKLYIRLAIEESLYHYRELIVKGIQRDKVIDLINLIINYLLIVIQVNNKQSLQKDIDKIDKILKQLQNYCKENRNIYPVLDLYKYFDILIALNSQRIGLDKANQSAFTKIAEKIIQLLKFGDGFVSIAEVKQIFQLLTSQDAVQQSKQIYDDYNIGNLSQKLCALRFSRFEIIQEDNLTDKQSEIIFYLEELEKIHNQNKQNSELVLFIYMQLNYLLGKEKNNDNFKEFSQNLKNQNKEDLILKFVNLLQLRAFKDSVIDYALKNIASQIVSNEHFRYQKAQLSIYFAKIIQYFDQREEEHHKIMIDLCMNYLQEKEMSVKIIYRGNRKMIEFIDQISLINNEEQVNQITNNIEKQEDTPRLLAINFFLMWEASVKQRQDQNPIAHKDDALLETIKLYITQRITFKKGNQIFMQSKDQKENDALQQIIDKFLIPNYIKEGN
ncbi:hypothetical protein ABPG72_002100 [Tetrahymena utriculariae]